MCRSRRGTDHIDRYEVTPARPGHQVEEAPAGVHRPFAGGRTGPGGLAAQLSSEVVTSLPPIPSPACGSTTPKKISASSTTPMTTRYQTKGM